LNFDWYSGNAIDGKFNIESTPKTSTDIGFDVLV